MEMTAKAAAAPKKAESQALKSFRKNKRAMFGAIFIIIETLLVLILPVVLHLDPTTSDLAAGKYAAPSAAHLLGTSIILITHDMGVIADIADDVMVMYGGNVVEQAGVGDIFEHPLHPYTQGLLASIPRLDQDVETLEAIEGTVPSLAEMPAGCHFSTRCPYCCDKCRAQRPPLADVNGQKVACWKYLPDETSK